MSTKISIIIGPPGTGKTTTLSHWVSRAASRYGPEKVIVCSLTRTAAYHAARNIELPFSQFGTVHAFAYRALGEPVIAEARIGDWNAAYPSHPLSGAGTSKNPDDGFTVPESATSWDVVKMQYAKLRTQQIPRTAKEWMPSAVRGFAARWDDWKKQCGYVDFTDLLEQAIADVDEAPGSPAVIIGDEWQDVGSMEMQLITKWAEKAEHLVLAGDFFQALFSFRGTNPKLLLDLWRTYDPDRKPLNQSYRLPRKVYEYAYNWQKRFKGMPQVPFNPRTLNGVTVEGELIQGGTSFDRYTAEDLTRLVKRYTGNGENLMFQATCGYMLERLLRGLREAGISFHNPLRITNGKWNPLPQKRSRGQTIIDRILAFTRPRADIWGEQAHFWTASELKSWVGGLPATGILSRGSQAVVQALKDDASDEEMSDGFPQWFTEEALRQIVPQPNVNWYLDKVKGSDVLRDYVKTIIKVRGVPTLQERPQVIVGTVHSLKGSEAETVVLFPDISQEAYNVTTRDASAAEELKRTFYVGITRAKTRLILAAPATSNAVRW